MSESAMVCGVLAALIQMNGRCHQPSDRRMLRDQARRTKEPSVPFVAAREAHGKRNYVAVFAFETSAFAGACS